MFKKPFSFDGRIRRTEYGISIIIYAVIIVIINLMIEESNGEAGFVAIAYIPLLWFLWAQGAKRCHDVGNNGWWQLIPFYGFWLIFQEGNTSSNDYGENPKGNSISNISYSNNQSANPTSNNSGGSYQGGYAGGHNNPSQNFTANQQTSEDSAENSSSYKNGDLYN